MASRIFRTLCTATLVALAFAGIDASAQVTIHMTTTQQADCDAITNAQGLSLVPGSSDLQATGVTLNGDGCGSGSADFQAHITVPGTATVGQPMNVVWSASQAATQCTYGGTQGLSGWTAGASACSGAACAGSHTVPVTVNAAGSYSLSVTCTNDSGVAQGAGTTTIGPPTPANFPLTAPSSAAPAVPFQVSWSVVGATSCTGSADIGGSSVSLPGWTDTTSATSPRTVTAAVVGSYTLGLTCSNTAGSVTSQPATVNVAVGGGGDSCPAGRITTATIKYPNIPQMPQRANVDVTQYDNIWGHMNASDGVTPWPGIDGTQPAILNWATNTYIAAKFHVPATQVVHYGWQGYGTYYSGPDIVLSYSTTCGDFAPVNPLCVSTHGAGEGFKKWSMLQTVTGCPLLPNTDYFVNMKMSDPNTCGANHICPGIAINNTLGAQ
jgi:hypothetical protein